MKKRRKVHILPFIIITILILAVGGGMLYWFVCISRPGKAPALSDRTSDQIRVATVNISGFRMLSNAPTVADFLLDCVRGSNIDILLIQEYSSAYRLSEKDFTAMFRKQFPYVLTNGEQAIASRYPILANELIAFPDSPDSFAGYLVKGHDGDTLSVLSVHLQTTGLMLMEKTGQSPKALWAVLSANDKVRENQALLVRHMIEEHPYPTVVAGDFNCIPFSKPYRIIRGKDLSDTYMEKGKGKGSTFRLLYDLLRIDYIMHSKDFECLDHVIQNDYISDHRMVVSTLQKTH